MSIILAVALLVVSLLLSPLAAEEIDLRDGPRTTFYGARFYRDGVPSTGDFYGWAMAFGDIDGDGYTDFLSSSANAEGPDDTRSHEHDAYLFFGRPTSAFDSLYAVDTPGVADIIFYKGGFGMACADVDRDGYDDIIMCEVPQSTDPAQGGVYVVFGAPQEELRTVYDFNPDVPTYTPPDILITGSTKLGGAIINNSYANRSLVSGDLNNDGYHDIIVGNSTACDKPGDCAADGAVYIVFGRPRVEFPPVFDVDYKSSLPHPDVMIHGDTGETYPTVLATGDLDGDGVDDLVASTSRGWGRDITIPFLGEIHGWWGKKSWKPLYDTAADEFDFSLQGAPGFTLGHRMTTGDLDGDARDELILGGWSGYSPAVPDDRISMGDYRVIFGRARDEWPRWGNAIEMTDVLILGAESGDAYSLNGPQEWGVSFSLATGNRNGDSYADLMIGAGRIHRPDDGTRPGGAYLIYGRPRSQWQPFIDLRDGYDVVMYGVDYTGSPGYQFDRAGFVVGIADVDNNGYGEMFVAAPFADGPDNSISDAGEIYIVFDTGPAHAVGVGTPVAAARAALFPTYPNPFGGATTIPFQAPAGEVVSVTVYDALGREVARPLAQTTMAGDQWSVRWNGTDATGRDVPAGVYFVKLRAGVESHARKVLLVR